MKKKNLKSLKLNKKLISNFNQLKGGDNTVSDCDIMETRLTFNFLCDPSDGQLTEYNTTCGLNCGFPTFEPTKIGC